MKNTIEKITWLLCLSVGFSSLAYAQNTFPSNGNVGIGTTGPAALLEVKYPTSLGTTAGSSVEFSRFSNTNGNYCQLRFLLNRYAAGTDWTGTTTRIQAFTDVTGQGYLDFNPSSGNYGVALGTGSTELIRLSSNGFIGIGTLSPSFKLDINSPDNDGATRLRLANISTTGGSTAGSLPTIEVLGARGDGNNTFEGRLALGTRRTDGTALSTQTLGAVLFGGQYGTDNTFQSSKILYASSIQGIAEGSFSASTTMPTAIAFFTGSAGNDVAAVNYTYGTERMRITNSGKVGIGTNNPGGILQVSDGGGDGTKYGAFQIVRAATPGDNVFHLSFVRAGNNVSGMGYTPDATGTLGIWQANTNVGTPLMCFNVNQTVGINTLNTQGYTLAVNGSAIFTKAVVKLYSTWPDYVFKQAYELRPLAALEAYIQTYHHLPEVPTEDEVKKNGIDLGASQNLLLKKIEELTLYIIAQDKKLQEDIASIENMKKQNTSLLEALQRLDDMQEQINTLQKNNQQIKEVKK